MTQAQHTINAHGLDTTIAEHSSYLRIFCREEEEEERKKEKEEREKETKKEKKWSHLVEVEGGRVRKKERKKERKQERKKEFIFLSFFL